MSHYLHLCDIRIGLGRQELLHIEDLRISGGEAVTVMGASGSGKSCLLSYICGVLSSDLWAGGRVICDGEDITEASPSKRHCGILFQDALLFPHLSIVENLAFGLVGGGGRDARMCRIEESLSSAGLAGMGERYPHNLSGGEGSRVALLRVLLSEPRALLLDEPFSALDTELRQSFRAYVLACAVERGLPILLVTHDIADAEAFGNNILKI